MVRWGIGVLVLLVAVGTYFGAHKWRTVATPLWSEADLPELPPQEDNAFFDLPARPPFVSDDMRELVHDYASTDVREIWEEASERQLAIADHLAGTSGLRGRIRERSRFVAANRLLEDARILPTYELWKLRSLDVLSNAVQGQFSAAFVEARSMWKQAADYTTNCRSLIACLVGVELMTIALSSADVLATVVTPQTARHHLASELEMIDLDVLDLEAGIFNEYQTCRLALETETGVFFDRAHTESMIRRYYQEVHRYVLNPNTTAPAELEPTRQPRWWAYNATGKRLVGIVATTNVQLRVERFESKLTGIRQNRTRIVASLREQLPIRIFE